MGNKPTKYFNILGEHVARSKVYLSVLVSLIIFSGMIGVGYYAIIHSRVEPFSAGDARDLVSANAIEPAMLEEFDALEKELSPLEQLLLHHVEATRLDEVDSFIAQGFFGKEPKNQGEIVLRAQFPNLYKFRTEYYTDEQIIEFGYDGASAWVDMSSSKLNAADVQFFARVALMESSLAHLAWCYRMSKAPEHQLEWSLEQQPDEFYRGRKCAVIVSRNILPFPVYHYVDRATYHEVHRRVQMPNREGRLTEVHLDFDSPLSEGTCRIPVGHRLYFDGRLHDIVKYTTVRKNACGLASFFAAPQGSAFDSIDLAY